VTLTDFLLARIAEDEAAALSDASGSSYDRSGRVFAYIVRQLAVVYADHPDYRDEWRP